MNEWMILWALFTIYLQCAQVTMVLYVHFYVLMFKSADCFCTKADLTSYLFPVECKKKTFADIYYAMYTRFVLHASKYKLEFCVQ